MLRLLIDENFNHRILRGLKSQLPELDFVVVQQVGLAAFKDPAVLRWASQNGRIIVTHDKKTMLPYPKQFIQRGEPMAGVILVPEQLAIGRAIEDLELVIVCRSQTEMQDRIEYLPLRFNS